MVTNNKISILIVEDDSTICDALQEILISEGYNIHVSNNGQEALNFLTNNPTTLPNLILLDAMMPLMGGIEFRKIQMNHSLFSQIPVIMMSADVNIHNKLEPLKLHHFIKKPLNIAELIFLIEQL